MRKIKVIIISSLFFITLFSCEKEFKNPYDRDCPPEIWTPHNLAARNSKNGVLLTWEQTEKHFEGFMLEKSADSLEWKPVNSEIIAITTRKYTDTIPLPGKTLIYRIYAKADKNLSNYCYTDSINQKFGYFTDLRDGRTYKTIQICDQTWMAENLAYLPSVSPYTEVFYTRPYYYIPYYEGTNVDEVKATGYYKTYGVLYNWPAATNACPSGWHLPTDAEWTTLTDCLGGKILAGVKLKETGESFWESQWNSPNTVATNESGFSALPGGFNYIPADVGEGGFWWSSTEYETYGAWGRILSTYFSEVSQSHMPKGEGCSVRCVQGEGTRLSILTTTIASAITSYSATCGGNITNDGGATITQRGIYWRQGNIEPDANDKIETVSGTIGSFSKSITGLKSNTTYYYRAFAINSLGTSYGEVLNFTTSEDIGCKTIPGSFTDPRDGNTYKTIKLCNNQTWMAENLAYLPSVGPYDESSYKSPYYSVYGCFDTIVSSARATDNYKTYGVLYNWPAATNSCPTGWHLPTDAEWTTLTDYLGGEMVAGGILKETGTTHWVDPNFNATNEIGFTALPGGNRSSGSFYNIGYYSSWWSSTEYSGSEAWDLTLGYKGSNSSRNIRYKDAEFSVRCLKD